MITPVLGGQDDGRHLFLDLVAVQGFPAVLVQKDAGQKPGVHAVSQAAHHLVGGDDDVPGTGNGGGGRQLEPGRLDGLHDRVGGQQGLGGRKTPAVPREIRGVKNGASMSMPGYPEMNGMAVRRRVNVRSSRLSGPMGSHRICTPSRAMRERSLNAMCSGPAFSRATSSLDSSKCAKKVMARWSEWMTSEITPSLD